MRSASDAPYCCKVRARTPSRNTVWNSLGNRANTVVAVSVAGVPGPLMNTAPFSVYAASVVGNRCQVIVPALSSVRNQRGMPVVAG